MQQQIAERASQLRQFANDAGQQFIFDPVISDSGILEQWVAVCLALDTLEDSTDALVYWQESGLVGDVREKHIKIYGMFQAVTLQQQAIRKLYEVFVGEKLLTPKQGGWHKITNVFRRAVQSPLEGWDPSNKLGELSQITITSDGYYIVMWDCHLWDNQLSETEPERIHPDELLEEYTAESIEYLNTICAALEAMGT